MPAPEKNPTYTHNSLQQVEKMVAERSLEFEKSIKPLRKELHKKYPVVFLLLVTFGVTAVFTGIEQWLLSHEILKEYPLVILGIGVAILTITGTVYRKLG